MNKTKPGRLLLLVFAALGCLALLSGCRKADERLEPRSLTWAELRTVRNPVLVTPPGDSERGTFAHERLADGAKVSFDAGGWRGFGVMVERRSWWRPGRLTLRRAPSVSRRGASSSTRPPARPTSW